ncbi:MAG: hypothetical protein KUG78_20975 [Kangiellaceae bacterium]|nr:hypothetical protein [Kangiellaceae bacterium]
MIKRLLVPLLLVCNINIVFADNVHSDITIKLHETSSNLKQHLDHESIVDSIYEQIRPRAKVTNNELSTKIIDEKVRKYIVEKYSPALIGNYEHLYLKLKSAKKDFSNCDDLKPINPNDDVLMTLCVIVKVDDIHVIYMTNGYSRGWKKTLDFIFTQTEKNLSLSSIELQMGDGVQAYVEGI